MDLQSILKNDSSRFLFKKDMMRKLRLEYELWCPLCEAFAPNPSTVNDASQSSVCFLVQTLNRQFDIKEFAESRFNMQKKQLGFIPVKDPLPAIASSHARSQHVLVDFSNAMKALYMDEYLVSEAVHARREAVRSGIEQVVTASGAFPEGTRVAVFGSSANGFG